MRSKLHNSLNAQGNSQQAGLPTLLFVSSPSSSANCRAGREGKKQEGGGGEAEPAALPARALILWSSTRAQSYL